MSHNFELNAVDLLFKPDGWLDNHLISLCQELDQLRQEIKAAQKAKAIKRDLQNRNVVIVTDIVSCISIIPPTQAVEILAQDIANYPDFPATKNAVSQISTWEADGYTTKPENG